MTLAEVSQLVCQHGRQLVLISGIQQNAEVYSDDAAGNGKRVELRAVDDDKFKIGQLHFAVWDQAINQVLEKLISQWQLDRRRLLAQLSQP